MLSFSLIKVFDNVIHFVSIGEAVWEFNKTCSREKPEIIYSHSVVRGIFQRAKTADFVQIKVWNSSVTVVNMICRRLAVWLAQRSRGILLCDPARSQIINENSLRFSVWVHSRLLLKKSLASCVVDESAELATSWKTTGPFLND